jgi:alanyl-tRNA synthetase
MTERLYYTDPSLREFDAVVTSVEMHEGRPAARLDRTAFYPTSGGQPFDTGRLGPVRVVDVVDTGGDVLHIVDGSLSPGDRVRGEIDWARRFDHMQQHTGQHVLSAAFELLFENRTVSFHLGVDTSTIDLAREQPPADVERAVDQANRVVWEDRAVSIRFVSEDEARALPLRKESVRQGELRLIDIADFDLSACGGTHVARTGSIGIIAVLRTERFKGGMRVAFACGGRALRALREQRDVVAGSIRALSVLPQELPAAIDKLQVEAKALRKQVSGLQVSLAQQEAEQALAALTGDAGTRVVIKSYEGWDANGLKAVASALSAKGRVVAVLVSSDTPALVVVARSPDVVLDANAVVRTLTAQFGGRGGGKPELAQAGGLAASTEQIMAAARDALRAQNE